MRHHSWTQGNTITLLENGEAFFPAVFADISAAKQEVILETFIWLDDAIGRRLREALLQAAANGASVDITVDGHGSAALESAFIEPLTDAGVRVHVFGPMAPKLGVQINLIHRLHRKLVALDQRIAYIGGINFSDAHMRYYGAESKQDYALRAEGPIVSDIRDFCFDAIGASARKRRRRLRDMTQRAPREWTRLSPNAQALFVTRDNDEHRTDIEAMYLAALRGAERDIIIMNSYFFPSHRFLRAMRQAVQRGARLRLLLQGNPDKDYVKFASETLYDRLLDMGVEIWEYTERPSHAKVAVIDDNWVTVGSSNLDPFSLSLNLEANLVIRDKLLNRTLRTSLEHLLQQHARRVPRTEVKHRLPIWRLWRVIAFHLLRYFPKLSRLIPVKRARVSTIEEPRSEIGPRGGRIGHAQEPPE